MLDNSCRKLKIICLKLNLQSLYFNNILLLFIFSFAAAWTNQVPKSYLVFFYILYLTNYLVLNFLKLSLFFPCPSLWPWVQLSSVVFVCVFVLWSSKLTSLLLLLISLFIDAMSMLCLVAQSCLTLCDPHGWYPKRLLCPWGFSRQEYWSGLPCPPPEDLPNPGIEPSSPALQSDSLLSEPSRKP